MNSKHESANLDLLRSCAVLFVLVYHLLRAFDVRVPLLANLGHWGVLVFFVHTSLVLLFSLERQLASAKRAMSKTLHYAQFQIRRAFRIYPASILIALFVWSLSLPMCAIVDGHFVGAPIGTLTLLANVFLFQNLVHVVNVPATLWSLPYELQMYAVLPFLFWATKDMSLRNVVVFWVAVAALCGITPNAFLKIWDMPIYVPCFLSGVVAYQQRRATPRLPYFIWPLVVACATFLYLGYRVSHTGTKMGWVACLLLGLSVPHFRDLPESLHAPFKVIARYSYGIYLTHYVTIWFSFEHLAGWSRPIQWMVFLVTTAGSSVLLYHLIEHPMVIQGTRAARRAASPALLADPDT